MEAAKAFANGRYLFKSNTEVNSIAMRLHGNEIMHRKTGGAIEFTLAGWNTPTTRERINGTLAVLGYTMRVRTIKGVPHIVDGGEKKAISADEWYQV